MTQADLDNYSQQRNQEFRNRLAIHLSELLQSQQKQVDMEHLYSQIDKGLKRAKRYLLTTESDIARYLEIMCVRLGGLAAERDPITVQNMLFDRRVEIAARLDGLEAWANQNQQPSQ